MPSVPYAPGKDSQHHGTAGYTTTMSLRDLLALNPSHATGHLEQLGWNAAG